MSSTTSGSKRWTHFHSALQLAIQRSTHKWTYEDFTECFSLWCEEDPESSSAVFNTVAQHMESAITNKCEEHLAEYGVKENLDKLHAVVTEARARKQTGYDGKDVWKEDLQPRAAVRARTVPLLEKERDRLKAQLEELDQSNSKLKVEMQANVQARLSADDEAEKLLDALSDVCKQWSAIPMDDIQSWALQTAESINASAPC